MEFGFELEWRNSIEWNYGATDRQPIAGWNYYRLKIIDTKNKIFYSAIKKIWIEKSSRLSVFPNPAEKEIYITLPAASSVWHIEIVNVSGGVVYKMQTTSASATINVQSLGKGVYFVRFRNQYQSISHRFIKK